MSLLSIRSILTGQFSALAKIRRLSGPSDRCVIKAAARTAVECLERRVMLTVTATAVSTSEIDLSWPAVDSRATGVEIDRSGDGTTFTTLATLSPSATSYSDTGLQEASPYEYRMQTLFASGGPTVELAFCMSLSAAPSGLTATSNANGSVTLSWTDNSQLSEAFNIYRSDDGVTWTQIDAVDAGTTTYEDDSAVEGANNYYEVSSADEGGESGFAAQTSVVAVAPLQLADDSYNGLLSVTHGQTLNITADIGGVLSNDTDPNGYALEVASYTSAAHGTVTVNSDGTFNYTSNVDFTGIDTFTYTATDQLGASSNSATVSIQVTDDQPLAVSASESVGWQYNDGSGGGYGDGYGNGYGDGYGGPSYYTPTQITGTLDAFDSNGDSLTYSASTADASAAGTFTYDSNNGSFAFTPNSNFSGVVTVPFHVSDGALVSNTALLLLVGWTYDSSRGGPDVSGDGIVYARTTMPGYAFNEYGVYQGGSLQASGQDLIDGRPNNPFQVEKLIEQPQHGGLNYDPQSGDFTYSADTGFTGRDWFTYQVKQTDPNTGAEIPGGSVTALIDVNALPASVSVAGFGPGDPYAVITGSTSLDMSLPSDLPVGSTVTLSTDDATDIQVLIGDPGSGQQIIGGGTSSHTWTVGSDTIPQSLSVVGVNETNEQQVHFSLSTVLGVKIVGLAANAPPAPADQPVSTTTPATVVREDGFLTAFDGAWDFPNNPDRGGDFNGSTVIYKFYGDYLPGKLGSKNYYPGTGNMQEHKLPGHLLWGMLGGPAAGAYVGRAMQALEAFYSDPLHRQIPVDIVGFSRGAFEATKLANLITQGIPDISKPAVTTWTTTTDQKGHLVRVPHSIRPLIFPWIRFVGIVSPVGQMGLGQGLFWPTSLPSNVGSFAQALDGTPGEWPYLQTPITITGQTPDTITYDGQNGNPLYNHETIGVVEEVLSWLELQAIWAGVPLILNGG
jgi:hypothetical protein